MKTVLQVAIKNLKGRSDRNDDSTYTGSGQKIGLETAIKVLESLLEKEREMVVLAHINGQSEFDNGAYRQEVIDNAEEYYNETFNTNER